MRSAAALLSLAASAFAYQVTFPTSSEGWTNSGAQTLSWTRVDTDPTNFTVVLKNSDPSVLADEQVLAAQVDGTLGNTTLNPPSGGWPSPAGGYQVNLVQNTTELNTILAQSNDFNITESTSSSSSSSTGSASSGSSTGTPSATTTDSATGPDTSSSGTDSTSSPSSTTSSKNGAVSLGAQTGLFGVLALAGALLF